MPSGILGTALTGLMAFQRSMQTTSNNVANVNTDGYSRQDTNLTTNPSSYNAGNFVGNGVDVTSITRNYDQFINNNIRSSASSLGDASAFQAMTAQVDNLLANPESGMSNAIKSFFNSVNGVASDPTSIPARQVMVSEAKTMSTQFNIVSSRLDTLRAQNNAKMQDSIDKINSFTQNIADLNVKIASLTSGGGQSPNELLDQRDSLLAQLAEHIDVATLARPDGSIDVFIGQGQALISGDARSKLELTNSTTDIMQKTVLMNGYDVSSQFSSGALTGAIKFRDQVLDPAQQQLGLVAAGIGQAFNELHTKGVDLNGAMGKAMFTFEPEQVPVFSSIGNAGGYIKATFDPATMNQLQASDYRLDYAAGAYTLTRLSDNTKVMLPTGGLPTTVDGINITQVTPPAGTSSFIIRPTYLAAKNINAVITDPRAIAASSTSGDSGDNTNALALASLENQGLMVNLDEEAANLIKFQNAYQASSQVIAISRSLFDSLLGAIK